MLRAVARLRPLLLSLLLTFAFSAPLAAFWGVDWKPITPEEMALAKPRLDADAGGEVLFREMKVDDSGARLVTYKHYVRLKVFDQRGIDAINPVQIMAPREVRITDVAARVIKPDGSITELTKKDVFARETIRYGEFRWRTHSFSFPGVEPGCIVEYQWQEIAEDNASGTFFRFAHEFPTHVVRFSFTPMSFYGDVTWISSSIPGGLNMQEKGSAWVCEVHDLPAIPEEPYMPPLFQGQPWIMVVYTKSDQSADDYWQNVSQYLYEEESTYIKAKQRSIKDKAAELTAGLTDDAAKVKAIYDFCTHEIGNLDREDADVDLRDVKKERQPKDTLELGFGTPWEVNMLFGSLVQAAGFDVRLAMANDRSQMFFDKNGTSWRMTPDFIIAVRLGDQWTFHTPGVPYLPYGMLHWNNDNTTAVVANKKEAEFVVIPPQKPELNQTIRRATLVLDEEGNATGKISYEYTGQRAMLTKQDKAGETPEEREQELVENLRKRLPDAKVSNIVYKNLRSPDENVILTFDIEVPAYADAAGDLLFFTPNFFEKGRPARLTREERVMDVYFKYPEITKDIVKVTVPEGFKPADAIKLGDLLDSEALAYKIRFGMLKDKRTVYYECTEKLNVALIPKAKYKPIKIYFDAIHELNETLLSFRREDPAEATAAVTPAP